MNDTCATHWSRVPRRSFGRVKWGVTTVEDERGPGLDFSLCFVCGSRPWGAAAFHLCLFILLLKSLNVRRFPPPSSHTYELCYTNIYECWWSFYFGGNTQEVLSASFCWQQHADISPIYLITNLGRCLSHVSHCQTPPKKKKEQLSSKCFSVDFPRTLDLVPRACAALFEWLTCNLCVL